MYFLFYMRTLPFYLYVLLLRTQCGTPVVFREINKLGFYRTFSFVGGVHCVWFERKCLCKAISNDLWFWNAINLFFFSFNSEREVRKKRGRKNWLKVPLLEGKKLSMDKFFKCTLKCFLCNYMRGHFMVPVMNLCLNFSII